MPRIDTPRRPEPGRPAHHARPATGARGPLPRPSVVEEVFKTGLDDLDAAFSRTVPVEDATPVEAMELDWDLPAPAMLNDSSPLAARAQPVAAKARVSRQGTTSRDIEDVVRRVMARMTDDVVRQLVSETAERLIREELDRLKR